MPAAWAEQLEKQEEIKRMEILFLGKSKETGIWIAPRIQYRVLWKDHDALYIAIHRLRIRIKKWFA